MRELVIIGAGVAGLAAGQELEQLKPLVLEKSRGLGGRLHSRTLKSAIEGPNTITADIGAQYFTARHDSFLTQVKQWQQQGVLTLWQGQIASWHQAKISHSSPEKRWVGLPKMQQITKLMAKGLDVQLSSLVTSCLWLADQECWQIELNQGSTLLTRRLLLACPLDQAQALLANNADEHSPPDWPAPMQPCLCFVIASKHPLTLDFDGLFVNDQPIAWMARNNSKPGREPHELWVIHLSSQASKQLINLNNPQRWQQLWLWLKQLELPIDWQDFQEIDCHLWRYARPADQRQQLFMEHQASNLWLAGDWLAGGRVEGAWLSGKSSSQAILDHFNG